MISIRKKLSTVSSSCTHQGTGSRKKRMCRSSTGQKGVVERQRPHPQEDLQL